LLARAAAAERALRFVIRNKSIIQNEFVVGRRGSLVFIVDTKVVVVAIGHRLGLLLLRPLLFARALFPAGARAFAAVAVVAVVSLVIVFAAAAAAAALKVPNVLSRRCATRPTSATRIIRHGGQ